ncbi:MAG: CPBP family glutamic-type intramembrane protease [Gemmataceae bacterium]
MPPGPDPLHAAPLAPLRKPKRRKRGPKPSRGRVVAELVVVLLGLAAVIAFVPLSSRWFPWVCGAACGLAGGYAVYGAVRRPGAAAWWGFTWGGRSEDDLAAGVWNTALLFLAALVPIGVVRYLVTRPTILDGGSYLLWCVIQDFLFFSLVLRGLDRLLDGKLAGHRHLAVSATAALFGLSHYPLAGFMAATALIAVCWGHIFFRTHLLWPVTVLHFLLGLLVLV